MNTSWKVILAFIGVFVAGSVFGGFSALRIARQVAQRERPRPFVPPPPQQFQPQGGAPQATQLLRRFAQGLALTDEQREKLRPMVNRAEEQIGRLRQKSLEDADAILRQLQQEFQAELTPEQRRRLERMKKNQSDIMRQERMKRQQQAPPGFGPGPQGGQFNPNQGPNQPNFGPNQPNPQRRPSQPPPPQGPPPHFGPPPPGPPPGQPEPGRPGDEPAPPAL